MYEESGDSAHAEELATRNLALAKNSVDAQPNNLGLLRILMNTQATLADLLTNEKNYAEAIPIRQSILDTQRRIDPHADANLALAHKKLGALYGVEKRYEEGRREYLEALQLDEKSVLAEPTPRSQLDLSYDYSDLGWVTIRLNDLPSALVSYRKALELRQAAAAADPNDYRAAVSIASSRERIAGLLHRMKDFTGATREMQEALARWKDVAERPGAAWSSTRNLADTHAEFGDLYVDMKNFPGAVAAYEQAAKLYASLRDRGTLPKALIPHVDELRAQADKCRKSACAPLL
jgi:tetratricopeptide (TPR) repeat protein